MSNHIKSSYSSTSSPLLKEKLLEAQALSELVVDLMRKVGLPMGSPAVAPASINDSNVATLFEIVTRLKDQFRHLRILLECESSVVQVCRRFRRQLDGANNFQGTKLEKYYLDLQSSSFTPEQKKLVDAVQKKYGSSKQNKRINWSDRVSGEAPVNKPAK